MCGFTFVSCFSTCAIWFLVSAVSVCVNTENIDGFRSGGGITFGGMMGCRTVVALETYSSESLLPLGCAFSFVTSVFCVRFNFQRDDNTFLAKQLATVSPKVHF